MQRLHDLARRARTRDLTVYRAPGVSFTEYYGNRLSAAAAMGDARRCLRRLTGLKMDAMQAIARNARPAPPAPRHATA